MTQELDRLARALAGKVSRREALKRSLLGALGATLAVLWPARARAKGPVKKQCAAFCNWLYGGGSAEAEACIAQSRDRTGVCYEFGPASPGCVANDCPKGTVCVVQNFGYYGPGSVVCVPI